MHSSTWHFWQQHLLCHSSKTSLSFYMWFVQAKAQWRVLLWMNNNACVTLLVSADSRYLDVYCPSAYDVVLYGTGTENRSAGLLLQSAHVLIWWSLLTIYAWHWASGPRYKVKLFQLSLYISSGNHKFKLVCCQLLKSWHRHGQKDHLVSLRFLSILLPLAFIQLGTSGISQLIFMTSLPIHIDVSGFSNKDQILWFNILLVCCSLTLQACSSCM